jgi:tyrosinase
MATLSSPYDPIFWFHHANIDRLWKVWLRQDVGTSKQRKNPTDSTWLNQAFQFYDEVGALVTLTVKDVLDTVNQLGYRYDDDPVSPPFSFATTTLQQQAPAAAAPPEPEQTLQRAKVIASTPGPAITLRADALTVELSLAPAAESLNRLARANDRDSRGPGFMLTLDGIQADRPPGASYEIYINLPDNNTAMSPTSPHFAGLLTFFGLDHGPHEEAKRQPGQMSAISGTQRVFVTDAVRGLVRLGLLENNNLKVTFRRVAPVPVQPDDAQLPVTPVTVQKVTLSLLE